MNHHTRRFVCATLTGSALALSLTSFAGAQCQTQVLSAPDGADPSQYGRHLAVADDVIVFAGEYGPEGNRIIRLRRRPDLLTAEWDELIDDTINDLSEDPLHLTGYGEAIDALGDTVVVAGVVDEDGDGQGRLYVRAFELSAGEKTFPTRWDAGDYSPSSNVLPETIVCKMQRVELAGPGAQSEVRILVGGFDAPAPGMPGHVEGYELRFGAAGLEVVGDFFAFHPETEATGWGNVLDIEWHGASHVVVATSHGGPLLCPNGECVRLSLYERIGDGWLPRGSVTPPAYDGVVISGDLAGGAVVTDPIALVAIADSDDDGLGSIVLDAFQLAGGQLQYDQPVTTGLETNPLYTEATVTHESPLYDGGDGPQTSTPFVLVAGACTPFDGTCALTLDVSVHQRIGDLIETTVRSSTDGGVGPVRWMAPEMLRMATTPGPDPETELTLLVAVGDDAAPCNPLATPGCRAEVIRQIPLGDLDGDGAPDRCVCPNDLDRDGTVGLSDLLAVLSSWSGGGAPAALAEPADVTGLSDLLTVLASWGTCP